jgi:hypothetical protein
MQPPNSEPSHATDLPAQPHVPGSADARIAPYAPGKSLSYLQYETVKLDILSTDSFSYWTTHWPKYSEVVFPLLDQGMMLAHVRKIERVEERFLVHCEFVRRLSGEGT